MTCKWWLSNPKIQFSTWCQNRLSKALQRFDSTHYLFVPGLENPGDIASRGLRGGEVEQWKTFRDGPTWLKGPPEGLPAQPTSRDLEEAAAFKDRKDFNSWKLPNHPQQLPLDQSRAAARRLTGSSGPKQAAEA